MITVQEIISKLPFELGKTEVTSKLCGPLVIAKVTGILYPAVSQAFMITSHELYDCDKWNEAYPNWFNNAAVLLEWSPFANEKYSEDGYEIVCMRMWVPIDDVKVYEI